MQAIYQYPFSSVHEKEIAASPPSRVQKGRLRIALGIPGVRIALCVGRFLPIKGFDVAIDAWREMPTDYSLVLAGGGPEEANYRARVLRYGLRNIFILGFQQAGNLRQLYDAADLLVFPTRGDVWGLVVNEAFARGLPAVTSDRCGAARDLLADGTGGMVVPAGDADALADTVLHLLHEERSLTVMAAGALETSREYTIEAMAVRHCDAFREAGFT
jgi:glycosyltransferase involved in cell wall biosynthesis